ncbi:ketohexokinase-like isoform X2 [Toxorhynchites rutilus septentrionalis]|uniref:ketohexokinase-like isoform X2 n=1 Tax=Toxorhynchites rutilus septentrionalis TaxID=329112 RepID=UPI0024794CD0|nr:ketohexokinase-like isoform X2 [Toxorhynchites rutilus septentrionalis]
MANKRILCVGLCNLDIIQVCGSYPLEDSDQRSNRSIWQRGGNASNNCTVLSLLGAKCELLATFSDSEHFTFALRDLERHGIPIEKCAFHKGCEIPLSTVWINEATGSRTIVHSNLNLPEIKVEDFARCDLSRYSWVHFEGRRSASEIAKMIETVRIFNTSEDHERIRVSVDLEKPRNTNLLLIPNVDIIFLGKDFARFLGYDNSRDAVHGFKKSYPGKYTAICPWGSSGVSALDGDNKYYSCGVYPPAVIRDTLGAGDTFCAGCILQLNKQEPLQAAIEYGSKLAGLKIGDYGFDHLQQKLHQLV